MEGPRAWDGIRRLGSDWRTPNEGELRGPPSRKYIGLAGIVLIGFGLPLLIIGLTVLVPCTDLLGALIPNCAPLVSPVIGLLFLVVGIALVIASFRLR